LNLVTSRVTILSDDSNKTIWFSQFSIHNIKEKFPGKQNKNLDKKSSFIFMIYKIFRNISKKY